MRHTSGGSAAEVMTVWSPRRSTMSWPPPRGIWRMTIGAWGAPPSDVLWGDWLVMLGEVRCTGTPGHEVAVHTHARPRLCQPWVSRARPFEFQGPNLISAHAHADHPGRRPWRPRPPR